MSVVIMRWETTDVYLPICTLVFLHYGACVGNNYVIAMIHFEFLNFFVQYLFKHYKLVP